MKIVLPFFFKILVFCVEKLQEKIKVSTESKRKFKNSSIQPRTSRSNFGKISFNFEKIGPGEGPEAALAALEAAQMRPRASRATTKNCFLLFFLSFFSLVCLVSFSPFKMCNIRNQISSKFNQISTNFSNFSLNFHMSGSDDFY